MNEQEYLAHYGVKGMKWGVRRAAKQLGNASTKEGRTKAISSLDKHREKATRKVAKLEKKHDRIQKNVSKHIRKTDVKVAKLNKKALKYEKKAYSAFTTQGKSEKNLAKAGEYKFKADRLKAKSDKVKAKLQKNEEMQRIFKTGISAIDAAKQDMGYKYVKRLTASF